MVPYKGSVVLIGKTLVWTTSMSYANAAYRAGYNKQISVWGMDVSASGHKLFKRKHGFLYVDGEPCEIPLK